MEFKRKQKVLRQKFIFRVLICIVSLICSMLYLRFNDDSSLWGMIVGLSGSALVWSLVELFDFFIQTYFQFESERNVFLGITVGYFCKMKKIIRENDKKIPMQDLRKIVEELHDKMNEFVFDGKIYPMSKEFELCSNYIERMYWKFYSCCLEIKDECEERTENYEKLYKSIILIEEQKEKTLKNFFREMNVQKNYAEMTDIDLSFEPFQLPDGIVTEDLTGNLGETITVLDKVRVTKTFIPDLKLQGIYSDSKNGCFCTVMSLIFRRVR